MCLESILHILLKRPFALLCKRIPASFFPIQISRASLLALLMAYSAQTKSRNKNKKKGFPVYNSLVCFSNPATRPPPPPLPPFILIVHGKTPCDANFDYKKGRKEVQRRPRKYGNHGDSYMRCQTGDSALRFRCSNVRPWMAE